MTDKKKSGFKPSTLRQRVRPPPTSTGRIPSPVPKLISGKTRSFFSTNGSGFPHVSSDVWRDFTDLSRADDYSCSVTQSQLDSFKKKTSGPAVCRNPDRNERLYCTSPTFFFLTCLQDKTGKNRWKTSTIVAAADQHQSTAASL